MLGTTFLSGLRPRSASFHDFQGSISWKWQAKRDFWGEKRVFELSRFRPRGKNLRKEPRCQEQLLLVTFDSILPPFMTSRLRFSKWAKSAFLTTKKREFWHVSKHGEVMFFWDLGTLSKKCERGTVYLFWLESCNPKKSKKPTVFWLKTNRDFWRLEPQDAMFSWWH